MGNAESLPVTSVVSSSASSSSPNVDMENLIIEETPAQSKPLICYATNEDFSQELSIFPDLVWKGILGYVTDTKTISALLNTSPYFHQKMKEFDGLLFNAALPLVMKSGVLDFPTTLECRLVNTAIKSTVDKTFRIICNEKKSLGRRSHYPTQGPYSFPQSYELIRFMNHFRAIIPFPSGNPFIHDCLKLWVHSSEYYERAMKFLTQFGHLIREMELTFEQLHHPATLMNRLIKALILVPNLEQLHFYFTGFPEIEMDVVDVDGIKKITTDLTTLSQFPVPPALEFPKLPQLSELKIQRYINVDVHPYPPPYAINCMVEATRVMLEAYGPQLSVLKCGKEMLVADLQPDFFSQQISNISELTIRDWGFTGGIDYFAKLSDVQLPKLIRLSLEMEGEYIQHSFLALLNNLRNSLKELLVWRDNTKKPLEIHALPRADLPHPVMLLPKLKLLIVEPPDLNMDMNGTFWSALRPRLRNLECLEFRVSYWSFRRNTTLPELQVRKNFFDSFPFLNQFIWKVTRDGHDGCVNSTVITRWDLQEGEQRVVSERIPYSQTRRLRM